MMNKPLWGQDVWEDTWIHLQKTEAILSVFCVLDRKMLIPSGNKEFDALAWVQSPSNCISKDDRLPLK